MGFFSKLFKKTVSLDQNSKDELVEMCVLKNNELKLNSELMVEDGYFCVIMHFDTMCDVLSSGKYKVNDVDTPRLYKFARTIKTKKGTINPKSVIADVYFVNMHKLQNNTFKSPYKIISYQGDKRVKVKIKGTFSVKVEDAKKLMASLLNDYAVLNKKVAIKEITAILSYAICDILNDKKTKLKDLQQKDPSLLVELGDKANKALAHLGVVFDDINITEVILPKNYVEPVEHSEEIKFEEKEKEQIKEKIPVMVSANGGEQEAKANTDNVINLGYSGTSPTYSPSPSSQEIYEQYSKQFDIQNEQIKPLQNTPHLLGNNHQEENNSKYSNFNEKTNPDNLTQQINLLGKQSDKEKTLSIDEYIERGKEIESIKEYINSDSANQSEKQKLKNNTQKRQEKVDIKQQENKNYKENDYKTCRSCGQRVGVDAKFCSNCGCSTSNEIVCKACGAKNIGEAKFCKICGSKLN